MEKQKRVLGISAGNRYTGFAVFENNELLEWGIKAFNEAWSEEKLPAIAGMVNEIIERYNINAIALKANHLSRTSKQLEIITDCIVRIAEQRQLAVNTFNLKDIKRHFALEAKDSIWDAIEILVKKYPELLCQYEKEKQKSYTYYLKMLEAVCVASIVDSERR